MKDLEECGVCGEKVENPCQETVCEPMVNIEPMLSLEDMVSSKLKLHFMVSDVDPTFIKKLIEDIVREDQLSRMGSIIKYLKTEEEK